MSTFSVRSRVAAFVLSSLLAASVVLQAPAALACACCADPGERVESSGKLKASEKAELEQVRFAKKARLYVNDAFPDGIHGLAAPTATYEIAQTRQGDRWIFSLKDENGKTGAISFTLPATYEEFFADLHDTKPGTETRLYKEWRFNAPLTAANATGIAAGAGVAGTTVRLVLQGRGNACTWAAQFTDWTLVVSGPKVGFVLFGKLSTPPPSP